MKLNYCDSSLFDGEVDVEIEIRRDFEMIIKTTKKDVQACFYYLQQLFVHALTHRLKIYIDKYVVFHCHREKI